MQEKNIITFDVEEWYDSFYLDEREKAAVIKLNRVPLAVNKILTLLSDSNTKATFFVVGKLAIENEDLIRSIVKEGHEIASHGYTHKPIAMFTPKEFEMDLMRSIKELKQITNKDILGYRAPGYSVTIKTLWALDIIKGCGLVYDSSIYPVSLRIFTSGGISGYPQTPFLIKKDLVEFPMITLSLAGIKVPVATTSYFRLFPYGVTKYAINKYNARKIPAVLNFHSWEFDEEQPKIRLPFPQNMKHYYGLNKVIGRFRSLLKEFDFISCKDALAVYNLTG